MGASCSHTKLKISNIDPDIYREKGGTWKYQVADAQCEECEESSRAIQKTCSAHNITQPWVILYKEYCHHDNVIIQNKKRNIKTMTFSARAKCVGCLISIPVYVKFNVKKINGINEDVLLSEWKPNMMMVKKEMDIAKEFNKGTFIKI